MKKIVLVGPVYPYKGGIAHYTGLMCRALRKKYDVTLISYSMQYPKIFFKREQRDYGNDTFRIKDTEYLINTAHPGNWIASAIKIRKYNPSLVIIQWWHPYFAPCYYAMCRQLKRYGIKVLFVCHNVFPHERFPIDKWLTKSVLKKGDYFIVHSTKDEEDLLSLKPDAVYSRTVMPTYNVFKLQNLSKEEGRNLLSIGEDEKVMLFFGFVREYKGLRYLIKAIPHIVECLGAVKVLLVGDFADDKDSYMKLIEDCGVGTYVDIYDGYVPDCEVEKFFVASDVVVLPYISATQSAIMQIAYGFEKPVIVTRVGGLPDVVIDMKTGRVIDSQNVEALADAVVDFYENDRGATFADGVREEAWRFSWDRMVEVIDKLVRE